MSRANVYQVMQNGILPTIRLGHSIRNGIATLAYSRSIQSEAHTRGSDGWVPVMNTNSAPLRNSLSPPAGDLAFEPHWTMAK